MYAAPFVADTQFDYESIMKQATGRCHRYGQQKDVHVYHFAMSRTAEVNILESRHPRQKLVKKYDGSIGFVPTREWREGQLDRFNGPALDNLPEVWDEDMPEDPDDVNAAEGN